MCFALSHHLSGGQVVQGVFGQAGEYPGGHSPVQAERAQRRQRGAFIPALLLSGCRLRPQDGGGIHVSG